MSKEIALIAQRPSYLAKADATKAALGEFMGGVQAGLALPMLSTRGKEFRLRFQGQEHNTREREMDVILVSARPGVSKRFYDKGYESGETEAPTCSSADGLTPDVPDPIASTCAACPKNVWGSDNRGKGKACSDYKRLVVQPFIADKLQGQPVVLDVSATALKSPRGFKGQELFLREYMTTLERHDLPPQAVVTHLGFTDAEYPQLHFGFARHAEQAEYEGALALREHPDVLSVLEAGQHEAEGPIRAAGTPAPTPAPTPKAKPERAKKAPKETPLPAPIFMWDDDQEVGAKVTTEEEKAKWEKQGAEEVTAKMYARLTGESETSTAASSTASAAPEATVEEVTEAPDEDVMADIQALLSGLSGGPK